MATFFVGQRVKKVRGMNVGNTGVVVGFYSGQERPEFSIRIRFDHAGPVVVMGLLGDRRTVSAPGDVSRCRPDHLEPIVPEGMQPVAWSECLWQPVGVAA